MLKIIQISCAATLYKSCPIECASLLTKWLRYESDCWYRFALLWGITKYFLDCIIAKFVNQNYNNKWLRIPKFDQSTPISLLNDMVWL